MTEIQDILRQLRDLQRQQDKFQGHFESEIGNYTRLLDQLEKAVNEKLQRVQTDADSEKETRRRRNDGIDARLRDVEDYINGEKGEKRIVKIIIGLICALLTGIAVRVFS